MAMAEKNVSIAGAAKATGLGGAVFLIPGVLAFFVLGKVFNMLRSLATAVGPKLGLVDVLGAVILDAAAIALVVLACFLAGLIARRATAQLMRGKLDQALPGSFPAMPL